MSNTEHTKVWRYWKEVLPDYFEKYAYTDLGFLKEVLEIEPDGYGGTNRIFYYKDGQFYTALEHWDGGNMWANVTRDRSSLTKRDFEGILNTKKAHILSELSENEKAEFESVFGEVKALILSRFDSEK